MTASPEKVAAGKVVQFTYRIADRHGEIMEQVDVSKPTVIKLFKQLSDQGILLKLQNKKYLFNETKLPIPERI